MEFRSSVDRCSHAPTCSIPLELERRIFFLVVEALRAHRFSLTTRPRGATAKARNLKVLGRGGAVERRSDEAGKDLWSTRRSGGTSIDYSLLVYIVPELRSEVVAVSVRALHASRYVSTSPRASSRETCSRGGGHLPLERGMRSGRSIDPPFLVICVKYFICLFI